MSALEVDNNLPALDTQRPQFDPLQLLTPQEVIAVMDILLACEVGLNL